MKRNLSGPFYLLLPLFLLSACSPIKPSVDSDKPYEFIRGAVIKDDDGFTTIIKNFVSTDGTYTRNAKYELRTDEFEEYLNNVTKKQAKELIRELEIDLKSNSDKKHYEICASIRDQILFLRDHFKIKKNNGKNR